MTKAGSVWMPVYVADFQADTSRLTLQETGAFILLCCVTWRSGKPLPDDDKRLANMCRVGPRRWASIRGAVMSMFELSAEGWTRKDVEREREKASARAQRASTNGRLGGRPKSLKIIDDEKGDAFSQVNPDESSSPSPSPIESKKEAKASKENAPRRRTRIEPDWRPNDGGLELAADRGIDVELEVPKFRDWHIAKGNLMADWQAAWRTWMRNATPTLPRRGSLPLLQIVPQPVAPQPSWLFGIAGVEKDLKAGNPMVNGFHLDVALDMALEAARMPADWRGDVRPLMAWLADEITPEQIAKAIGRAASRPNYAQPASLRYFDQPVRESVHRRAFG